MFRQAQKRQVFVELYVSLWGGMVDAWLTIVVCGHAIHGLSGTQVASTLLATVGQLLLHAAALQENVSQLQVLGIMINKFASWAARENGQDSQSPSLHRVNREAQLMILSEVTYIIYVDNYRRCFTVFLRVQGDI